MRGRWNTETLRRWWSAPLLRFVILGAALFALDRWRARRPSTPNAQGEIVLSRGFVAAMRAGLWRERGREPTAEELDARVREYVRDEALYRNALALGLDRGDGIIRRRLVQKATYLVELESEPGVATEAELRRWYSEHPERYRREARVDFEHRFFSADRRGARAAAEATQALATGAEGDPFLRGVNFEGLSPAEVAGVFGEGFATALGDVPTGHWVGPLASVHGQHLVRVRGRREGGVAPFDAVRAAVEHQWREAERGRRAESATRALVDGYRVVRE